MVLVLCQAIIIFISIIKLSFLFFRLLSIYGFFDTHLAECKYM